MKKRFLFLAVISAVILTSCGSVEEDDSSKAGTITISVKPITTTSTTVSTTTSATTTTATTTTKATTKKKKETTTTTVAEETAAPETYIVYYEEEQQQEEQPQQTEQAQQDTLNYSDKFCISYNGADFTIGSNFDNVRQIIGDGDVGIPAYISPNCMTDAQDELVYCYNQMEVTVKSSIVSHIEINEYCATANGLSTPQTKTGLSLSMSKDDMNSKCGSPNSVDGWIYKYNENDIEMDITIIDGVSGISIGKN